MLQPQHDTYIRVVRILIDVDPHTRKVADSQDMCRKVDEVLEIV